MSQIITIKQSDIEAVENATDLYNQAFERGSHYFELKSLMMDMLTDDNKILLKTIGMIVGQTQKIFETNWLTSI